MSFRRYSCFPKLQFTFTTKLFFLVLDRVLVFCLVEISWCHIHTHPHWQTPFIHQYSRYSWHTHLLRKASLIWCKKVYFLSWTSLLSGKGREKDPQHKNTHPQTLKILHSNHMTPIAYKEIRA